MLHFQLFTELLSRQGKSKGESSFPILYFLLKGRKDPSVVGDTTVLELFFVLGLYFLRIVSLVIKLGRGVTTHWQLRRKGVEGIDEVTGCLLSRL